MPLKMRPTGLGHGVYKDVPDYSIFCGEWCVGRIYETRTGPAIYSTLLASQEACAPTAGRLRWTGPRPSSRRAGSSGRYGDGGGRLTRRA